MAKKTKEEVLAWAKDPKRKKGDKLVIQENEPSGTQAISKVDKVVEKL